MVCIISPSKTMEIEDIEYKLKTTIPEHLDKTNQLVKKLEKYNERELADLMKLSEKLSSQTYNQYKELSKKNGSGTCPALFSYTGEVYTGLKANDFAVEDLKYANDNLRILSGLYGILKPSDGILPYRLEMAAKFQPNEIYKSLYQFWTQEITDALNQQIGYTKSEFLANLASNEYMKVVNKKNLSKPVINFEFFEIKNGERKFISFNAKRARGLMASYIIKNKIKNLNDLKLFNQEGYVFEPSHSNNLNFAFVIP